MTFPEFIEEWRSPKDFITAFTSGSTGTPKEIRLSKEFVANSAKRTIDFFGLNSSSELHSCVSPDFIGGKMMAVRAEIAGASLSWETPSNRPLSEISKDIDLLAVVPSQMIHILENLNSLPQIQNIIIGGSSIHPLLRNKIVESGLNAYETYGMTETASHIALRKITIDPSPFKCLEGIRVELDSEDCLKIIFDQTEGINGNPLTIQTNDIAEIPNERNSNQFFIKGRRDDIIITGARKVNPHEIEEKLAPFIPLPFYIKGIEDEKWGQKIVIILEGEKNETLENELNEIFRTILPSYQIPKSIFFVKSLPLTGSGKIKRV
ncbi:MAG: AMP-binding protein [Muribaculaceae bacterium]|nr:AMP-binding protein [Muribaculaceae bacterium]